MLTIDWAKRIQASASLFLPVVLLLASVFIIVTLVATRAWDDGAITLAFSRTFALTGRIALTPQSEQVEGFSSISWFLLNAAMAWSRRSFEQAILQSQILAAVFLTVSLYYLFLISRRLSLSPVTTTLILVIAAISGPSLAEIANGMEMTLLSASGLAITYHLFFKYSRVGVLIATLVFLTTRFEAIFYFLFLVAPLVFERRGRQAAVWLIVGVTIFVALGVLRFIEFSDFLPNTIYAKFNPPYRFLGVSAIVTRVRAPLELIRVLAPFVLVVVALWVCNQRYVTLPFSKNAWSSTTVSPYVLGMPLAGAILFAIVSGQNIGYLGRMQFFAIPSALLLLGCAYDRLVKPFRRSLQTVWLLGALLTLPVSWRLSAGAELTAIRHHFSTVAYGSAEDFGVTAESYRYTGLGVDHLRSLLHLERIVFMTPDVGGLSLCCAEIRVVDMALLTNHDLARRGYAAFPAVFASENPDVIEVHGLWASLSGIYGIDLFRNEYVPVVVNNTRMFLRRDHASAINSSGTERLCPLSDSGCKEEILERHRYKLHVNQDDDEQYLRFQSFIEIQ